MSMPEHLIRRRPARLLAFFLTALVICSSVLTAMTPQQAYAAPPSGCAVSGEAYAANVNALGLIGTKLGLSTLGGSSGVSGNLNLLAPLASLGATAVTTNSADTSSGGNAQATSEASIANLNLTSDVLSGLLTLNALDVTAGAIEVAAVSTATPGGSVTYNGTTSVTNLTINGQTFNGAIPPNTTVPVSLNVLGLGVLNIATVTINQQSIVNGALVVNGLRIQVLSVPALGLSAGDIVLASGTAKASCTSSTPAGITISGVSPTSGSTLGGTLATISGTGFSSVTTAQFGGAAATVVDVDGAGTTLTVRTPAHAAGTVDVVVNNPIGSPASATLPNSFTYNTTILAPTILDATLSCTNGVITLNITGLNFVTTALAGVLAPTLVSINGLGLAAGTVNVNPAAGTISTVVDPALLNQATNQLQLSNGGVLLSTIEPLDLSTVTACLNPSSTLTVGSVNPNQGPTGAQTPVTIAGTGFQAGATVTFGGQLATNVQVVSSSVITANTPGITTPGAVNVAVTSGGNTVTLTNGYSYVTPPGITTIGACIANGTAILTINGTNFLTGATISINGITIPANATVVNSAGQLTTTVSSSLLNLGQGATNSFIAVNIGNILSTQVNLNNLTNTCPAPVVNTVNPTQGPTAGGTVVTISGSNFQPDTTVSFGGTAGTNVVVAPGGASLTVTTPAHAAGAVDVVVTNPTPVVQSTTITNGFTYIAGGTDPSNNPSSNPSASPSTSPFPNPSTPGGNEGVPPTMSGLFLVGTGQVPPSANGRVTFLATIQDNFALGGIEASMNPNGPWQRVIDITSVGNSTNPFRVAGGFDTTNPVYGGSTAAGDKAVYLRAFDINSNVSPTQTLTVSYSGQTPVFSDVSGDPATVEAIYELAARRIINGYGDGTFGPGDTTTRAQMAALISRAMGWSGENHPNPFPDRGPIDDDLWRQVGNLNFYGVAQGYTDSATCASAGTTAPCYLPTDTINKLQTVSFITRAMVKLGYWSAQPNDPSIYPNIPVESAHRIDLVTYVHYLGAVPGTSATGNWTDGEEPASRAFFALTEWQAVKWRENPANWGVIPRP